ncbi:peptidoglycan DD-metalloendopeptidase family protein [Anaerotignum lactatifermentans]|uniref:Peptidoglycan DD-metalloendopeptidase family protein n=1 Tax=Anaerotignum lactatifermentans TaxID=160404 RepID=A0ABS2GD63_9FIRM|nr:M23 family metallopeptidase [Anaerotignum lactatifermentans]MBM6828670.1 peptidoglycan DD-metalloendopeptidase family protein [Anaerotignum lactatifermentans]MBM6878807.1 peptidoglycan DD-metalloendopeptidase family protein [Anaerotignum lactatifermentans]MBM6950252.1 peptidoglycan DD-metalloendopeptidase family protein [Anaerotignum lactatifermentans]
MEENQNLSKDMEAQKEKHRHFLTLHLSHKGETKTIGLKKYHAALLGAAIVCVLGGGIVATASYQQAKHQLQASEEQLQAAENANRKLAQKTEVLESENKEYTQNLEEIQQKTTQLEDKLTELETTKENLAEQINGMSGADTASAEAYLSILNDSQTTQKDFTTIVTTAYNKTEALSSQLEKMDVLLDEAGVSFQNVADGVTVALAKESNIPMGFPVENGIVSTEFNPGGDSSISDGRVHKGIDLSTRSQILPITATASGTVVEAAFHEDFGYYVKIDHGNGFTTMYAHNSENLVSVGDQVKRGDTIAMTGSTGMSTGIHCHYEIQLNGVYQNPRDFQ